MTITKSWVNMWGVGERDGVSVMVGLWDKRQLLSETLITAERKQCFMYSISFEVICHFAP